MKKTLFLSLMLCLAALGASAQNRGAIGGRIGSGLQVQGEINTGRNYFEGRFGMSWCNPGANLDADLTLLYNWNVTTMNWTPEAGEWFFDAGVGLSIGGHEHYAYVGPAGCARLGIKFNGAPVKLAVDWTPMFGPAIGYGKGYSNASFHSYGLANFGLSCAYYF